MGLKVQKVLKAMLVPQDSQVQMVPQDLKDTQAPQELQEKVVRVGGQDPWDQLGPKVHQAPLDTRAIQVFQVHPVQLASHLREFLVLRVPLEFQVPEVMMVSQDLLVLLVLLVHQER